MAEPLTPLLVRFGRMGDMVLQAPLLHLLHRRYGQPCILLSAGAWARELYAGSDDVSAVWQLRGRHTPFALSPQRWLLVRTLRRHRGPIYVSEDIPRQLQRIRALFARAGIDAAGCCFFDESTSAVHWVDRLLEFGKLTPQAYAPADYPWRNADLQTAPQLAIRDADRHDLDAWLQRRGIGSAPLVLIQPGNKRTTRLRASRQPDSKGWPADRWAALLERIRGQNPAVRFVLCGAPPEAAMLADIRRRARLDRVDIAARDLPLRRLLALAERAHSMIAVDTGPAHVAAAAGCPLIVMYGDESPARWDRRSVGGSQVLNLGGPPQRSRVDQIGVDEVIDAWLRLARGGRHVFSSGSIEARARIMAGR